MMSIGGLSLHPLWDLDYHLKLLSALQGRVTKLTAPRLKNALKMDLFNSLTNNLNFANSCLWLQALGILNQAHNER